MTATIELTSARRKLCAALGEKQKEYFSHMKSWFRKRISKEEFDIEARKLIPAENSHLHNEFFLAILNKCQTLALASFQPSISLKSIKIFRLIALKSHKNAPKMLRSLIIGICST